MAQDKVAIEHYVPRTYLEAFADERKQCFVFDKKNNKNFKSNVQSILAERYLYDFDKELLCGFPDVEEQAIEKILGMTVEGYWKNITQNIENNFKWFSIKYSWHFLDVYRCVAIQMLRTPNGKKDLLSIYNEVYEKEKNGKYENIVLAKEIFNILDDNMKSVLLEILLTEYGHITIGINETEIPFITSDTPVVHMPYIWDTKKEERMVFYPVTPTRCLILHKRNCVESQLNQVLEEASTGKTIIRDLADITQESYRREKALWDVLNPESRELSEDEILVLNTCCVGSAEQYIISSCDSEKYKLYSETYKYVNCM